jgi:hypothetical protein
MSILLECSLSINGYIKEIESYDIEVSCPCCGRKMWKHGKYKRTVHFKKRSYVIPILRRRCPTCSKTYSLIPCFIIPWARFANHIRELMGRWLLAGVPLARLQENLSTFATSIVSLKTLYRWKAKLKAVFEQWMMDQRNRIILSGEGEMLSLYRLGISTAQECEFFLSLFFGGTTHIPGKGRLFSVINIRLPLKEIW